MKSISQRLRKDFILVSVLSVLFITVAANVGISLYFRVYLASNIKNQDIKLVNYVEDYIEGDGGLNNSSIRNILNMSRNEGVEIKITGLDNTVLLNTEELGGMGMGMGRNRKVRAGNLVYREYPYSSGDKLLGYINIGRPASLVGNQQDKLFIYVINGIFIAAFIISIIIAFQSAGIVSHRFLKPLLLLKKNVNLITDELYNELEIINTDIEEISELSLSADKLARRFESLERLRKQLTADIAHELRTPLATLQSHLEAMIDGVWKPEPKRLLQCHDEVIRLSKMVSDLGDLSRAENQQMKLDKAEFNLSELVSQVALNMEPVFIEKEQSLINNIEPDIFFYGDRARISQIIVNLMANAYKYTNEKGIITIRLFTKEASIFIEVEDNGKGISQADLPYIFERFYRGEKSRSKETGGTGIGLTITKALVEAHGGRIAVQSNENSGAKFTVIFNK